MTRDAARVLEKAMQLTAAERAQIAEELLASLDDTREEVEAAWAAEITRRADAARNNPDDDVDWREALREVQQRVSDRLG
jgi:putative addiction module component (TIGR02574 family)